ncbi:mCG146145, partial [Mus musculus]
SPTARSQRKQPPRSSVAHSARPPTGTCPRRKETAFFPQLVSQAPRPEKTDPQRGRRSHRGRPEFSSLGQSARHRGLRKCLLTEAAPRRSSTPGNSCPSSSGPRGGLSTAPCPEFKALRPSSAPSHLNSKATPLGPASLRGSTHERPRRSLRIRFLFAKPAGSGSKGIRLNKILPIFEAQVWRQL